LATAADVPGVYDVVLNGQGFVFLDTIQPSLPFRSHKATYKVSQTFIERSNVTGAFGDNQQDWWMTASQNDWSLGEEQRFFRIGDQTSRSRYWRGMNVDLSQPGQVTIGNPALTLTFPSQVSSLVYGPAITSSVFFAAGSKDLFSVDETGTTITALGSHGCSAAPTTMAFDGSYVYMSSRSATSGVRRFSLNPSGAFETFSTSPASSLAFLNNTLYGAIATPTNSFARYDTAGAITIIQQWKTAKGEVFAGDKNCVLLPFGGRMLIMRTAETPTANELWVYDGNAVSQLAIFEPNFVFKDWCVAEGVVFIAGQTVKRDKSRYELRYYANGSFGVAYASQLATGVASLGYSVTPFATGVVFTEPVNGAVMYFDLAAGSASSVAPFTPLSAGTQRMATGAQVVVTHGGSYTGSTVFASGVASAASLQTSLFDFETSLDKLVRSVRVDFTAGTDGDGGAVDLYYTTNDVAGSLASIASSISVNTDYPVNIACRSISILAVLRKGTSTLGPTLKRIYVRAAPVLQQFKQREYVLDCSGDGSSVTRELRDGTPMPLTGGSQAASLNTLAQKTTPFSITDRFGTYTGLIDLNDPEGFEVYEVHSSVDSVGQSGSFVVRVKCREV
jgi:hypothetical protein